MKINKNINLKFKSHPSYSEHQWLQLDLGPPTLVTGIVTKGRGDKRNWVTSYSVSYSNDTKIWFYYKDANHLEAKVDNRSHSHGNYHVSCGATMSMSFKYIYKLGLTVMLSNNHVLCDIT